MALTEQETETLAVLNAKAAEIAPAAEPAEVAGETAAEVGAAVAEAVGSVAEVVAAVVAHEGIRSPRGRGAGCDGLVQ